MSAPVYLHIGLQKTGTSYLQTIFWANLEAVTGQRLDMLPGSRREAFHLMLDVRGRLQSFDPPQARAILPGLPARLAAATGTRVLISEESFSPCTDDQIERLLGAMSGREVHVIVTCRDVARQIPSLWQQGLQAGRSIDLPGFLRRLRRTEGRLDEGRAHPAWAQIDLVSVLERWARHVPSERIHVVTVPPAGAPHDELLARFCRVLDLDPGVLDTSVAGRANRGLRLEQAEVLRRINDRLPDELKRRDAYGNVGKRYLAVRVLGGAQGRRILLPASEAPWCEQVARRQVEHLATGGYDVVGDPGDLMPRAESFAADEQVVAEEQVADAALAALTTIVSERLGRELERSGRTGASGRRGRWRGLGARLVGRSAGAGPSGG